MMKKLFPNFAVEPKAILHCIPKRVPPDQLAALLHDRKGLPRAGSLLENTTETRRHGDTESTYSRSGSLS